jgi:hypothetical protein
MSIQAISAAVTISSTSSYATILSQSGGTTWSNSTVNIPSTISLAANAASSQALTIPITPSPASGATVTGYWTSTAPTTQPTTGQLTSSVPPLFNGSEVAAYLANPASTGVWYLSIWITNNGSNNGYVVLTPITWTA